MNEYKRALLKNNSPKNVEAEWIMLQDLSQPNFRKHSNHQQNQHGYTKFEDNGKNEHKYRDHGNHCMQKIEEIPADRPFNPKVITINGDTFKQVESEKEKESEKRKAEGKGKKTKLPNMQVACFYCTCVQTVPATSERFTCGRCASLNKCMPVYRILICGTCNAKVCYATGASDLIRCTRCSAINKVPLANGNPYEVEYRVASSLEREERETDPFKEEYLDISQGGLDDEIIRKEDFSGYLREK